MKIFLRSAVILAVFFSTILIIYAVPMTWEEIKSKDWQSDDSIVAEDFNTIIEQIAIHSGLDNFLGMFAIVVDIVQEIDEKFANIFSDNDGNVGIGTENPQTTLHVNGKVEVKDLTINGVSVLNRMNVQTVFPYSAVQAYCPSGSYATSVPIYYSGKTGAEICADEYHTPIVYSGDPGRFNSFAKAVYIFGSNNNNFGNYSPHDINSESTGISSAWPFALYDSSPDALSGEWRFAFYIVCCKP